MPSLSMKVLIQWILDGLFSYRIIPKKGIQLAICKHMIGVCVQYYTNKCKHSERAKLRTHAIISCTVYAVIITALLQFMQNVNLEITETLKDLLLLEIRKNVLRENEMHCRDDD